MSSSQPKIRVAIIGVGNCASSLYQGFSYYSQSSRSADGLMRADIGGYSATDIEVVLAFDVDSRKVGLPFKAAMQAKPNCTPMFADLATMPDGPIVQMGPVLDGVADVMKTHKDGFRVGSAAPVDVAAALRINSVDILINYLPVGSQKATEHYAECCLAAKCAFMNCIPVFIASDPAWEASVPSSAHIFLVFPSREVARLLSCSVVPSRRTSFVGTLMVSCECAASLSKLPSDLTLISKNGAAAGPFHRGWPSDSWG
jgi:myo-inositol-1-phosphate synthase